MKRARLCCCTVLFTLFACQSPEAGKAPAKVEPAKASEPAKGNPHGGMPNLAANPHGADPHGAPPAAPTGPVNPTDVKPGGQVRAEAVDGLSLSVPTEWVRKPAS